MKDYKRFLKQTGEYGEVAEIRFPLISVSGLPKARPREVIHFEHGGVGEVFSLHPDVIEVVMLNKTDISIHEKAARTDTFTSIPVGNGLLGTTINPIGETIGESKPNNNHKLLIFS